MLTGLVIKAISGFYTVQTDSGEIYICQLPGRLKKARQQSDLVTVGDKVLFTAVASFSHDEAIDPQLFETYGQFEANDDTPKGLIEKVAERQCVLSRTRPTSRRSRLLHSDREQVLVANPDQVIFVFSVRNPSPNFRKLDRFLVVAERNQLPALICINKIDLDKKNKVRRTLAIYEDIGYPVFYTSATESIGIGTLRDALANKLSVFSGSSGVGKSSLLNAIQPGLGLKASAVSQATGKGMHTTRFAELIPLEVGGYVADTPGVRGLALFDIEADELDAYFREIAPLVAHCQFSDCTHQHEPGCAVRQAVADGLISPMRYDSYLRLREEHEALAETAY